MYMCVCVSTGSCVHVCVCLLTQVHHIHVCVTCAQVSVHVHACLRAHACVCTHVSLCMYVCDCVHVCVLHTRVPPVWPWKRLEAQ